MTGLDAIPKEALYAGAGVLGFMVLFAIFMVRRSLRRVRRVHADTKAGLEGLGLRMVQQDGARTRSAGTYRDRPAWLETDGSAIMQAGSKAMSMGLATHFFTPAFTNNTRDWINKRVANMARRGMQNAPMQLRFGMTMRAPIDGTVEIRGEAFPEATAIDQALFVRAGADVVARLRQPAVIQALAATQFDTITVSGADAHAIWVPPNKDYQQEMARDGFASMAGRTLAALAAVTDALG